MREFVQRRAFFDDYSETTDLSSPSLAKYGRRLTCPCCGLPTLRGRASYEICFLCSWEDDGQDDDDAAEARGGPNHGLSLESARLNFDQYLVMYEPGRDPRISKGDSPATRSVKERIMAAFDAILERPPAEHESSWKTVVDSQRELLRLLREDIRDYEQRA